MNIQKILISQKAPVNLAPYTALSENFGLDIDFRQFFKIEPLPSKDFRAQKVNILDYTAVIFTSRHAIDAFFQICDELRVKVPETMKYFCNTEAVAMYLQKHIVYRKRKIFFGDGSSESIIGLIGSKHKDEKFLITSSESGSDKLVHLFEDNGLECKSAAVVRSVSQDLSDLDLSAYDMVVFYNPADVNSLKESFPEFEQGSIKFVSYGKSIVKAMEDEGLKIAIKAPTPDCPSVASAIERYLKANE